MTVSDILETIMILSFGISWPISIVKSYQARCTKGKSPFFLGFIIAGYLCGIAAKLISRTYNLALWAYFPNVIMVSIDLCLYFRNRRLEREEAL